MIFRDDEEWSLTEVESRKSEQAEGIEEAKVWKSHFLPPKNLTGVKE
jgi:hypothetical protein